MSNCAKQDNRAGQIADLQNEVAALRASQAQTQSNLDLLRGMTITLEKLNEAERAGKISPEEAQRFADILTGKTPLYVAPDGHMTTNKFGP